MSVKISSLSNFCASAVAVHKCYATTYPCPENSPAFSNFRKAFSQLQQNFPSNSLTGLAQSWILSIQQALTTPTDPNACVFPGSGLLINFLVARELKAELLNAAPSIDNLSSLVNTLISSCLTPIGNPSPSVYNYGIDMQTILSNGAITTGFRQDVASLAKTLGA